jgi:hypothetical protein
MGLISISFSQEIKAGITFGGNLYQNTKVTIPIYFPKNTYLTIIEEDKGKGIFNSHNVLNSYNLGVVVSVFYKKFSFSIEPQYMYKRHHLIIKKPQQINWILMEKGFRVPLYFSYRLTKNSKSIELLTGLTLFKTHSIDFQEPSIGYSFLGDNIYDGQINYGNNIFNGVLYNNKMYYMFLVGIKKPLKKWDMLIKFQSYLNSKSQPIEAKYFQIELSLNRYIFNSKNITNKHYLYVE